MELVQHNEVQQKSKKNERISLIIRRIFVYIFLIFTSIICIFPFYILLVNSTHAHTEIMNHFNWWFGNSFFSNFKKLLGMSNLPIVKAFTNSLFVSLACATLTVYFSALTAYSTHIYNFKGKKFVTTFILAIMMIPTQVASLGLVVICIKMNLLNSYLPIIIPSIASPVTYFYMKQYLASVLPYETIEAARVDGSSEIRIFHSIVLPMIKPALALQFIFAYVASWNNFFVPSMLIRNSDMKTVPLVIALLKNSSPDTFDLGPVYILMSIAVFPLLIIYLIFSKSIISGLTSGAVKG